MATIEAGTWTCRAVRGYLGEESKQGNAPVVIDLELLDPPVQGLHITAFLYFTDKRGTQPGAKSVAERSVEAMRALGFEGDDLNFITFRPDAVALAVCEPEQDLEGVMRMRVKWINRLGSNIPKLDPAKAVGFAQSMRGLFVKHDKANPPGAGAANGGARTAPARGRDEPPPVDDSDIPF